MQESWNPVRRRCVNCGSEVVGYRNEKDCVKLRCPKCGLVMVSKRMSRRRGAHRGYCAARGDNK